MTKKEFARLKTEPLHILKKKERFALPRIVDIQHPLDQKLVLIQILIMCAVLLLSRPFVSALYGVSRTPGMCGSTVKEWDIGEKTVRSSTEPARINYNNIYYMRRLIYLQILLMISILLIVISLAVMRTMLPNLRFFLNKLITLKTTNYMVALKVLKVT
jgi:hypothetical protein